MTLTPYAVRRMVWVAKESPRITAGESHTLDRFLDQTFLKRTVSHLHNHTLLGRVARRKPLRSRTSKRRCLQFARCYWNFQWDSILWAGETKIRCFWQQTPVVSSCVKYGGGSVMLWTVYNSVANNQGLVCTSYIYSGTCTNVKHWWIFKSYSFYSWLKEFSLYCDIY